MPVRTEYRLGEFSWVDLNSHDLQEAQRFYCDLFGWNFLLYDTAGGPPYGQFDVDGKSVCGIGEMSAEMKAGGAPPVWNSYVNVDSVEAVAERAEQLGAQIIAPPMKVLEAGWLAFIQDPEGAVIGCWQKGEHFGAELCDAPGSRCWNELNTKDADAAASFYGELFGWEFEDNPHSPTKYLVVKVASRAIGGILQMNTEWGGVPAHWGVYFFVGDIDATFARHTELSGQICVPPFDTPYGRMAVVSDPQGASFSLIQLDDPSD
ncbi:MAG: VOC family protein [Pirellulaceae bacterium]|jgi:hypothetical protein|nr:VOC family protein [Pirellulaceae bacterium]MDP7019684.1 VOC family protein [Pirellulaceae bacterium]